DESVEIDCASLPPTQQVRIGPRANGAWRTCARCHEACAGKPSDHATLGFAMWIREEAHGTPGGLLKLVATLRQRAVESRLGKERQQWMVQRMKPDRHPGIAESPDLGVGQMTYSQIGQVLDPTLQ